MELKCFQYLYILLYNISTLHHANATKVEDLRICNDSTTVVRMLYHPIHIRLKSSSLGVVKVLQNSRYVKATQEPYIFKLTWYKILNIKMKKLVWRDQQVGDFWFSRFFSGTIFGKLDLYIFFKNIRWRLSREVCDGGLIMVVVDCMKIVGSTCRFNGGWIPGLISMFDFGSVMLDWLRNS